MKKWTVWILIVLALFATGRPVAAEDSPGVLGLLEIRGLDTLAGATFELSKAAGQPMAKEMVSMILYGALGSMPGLGIPPDGTLRAVAFENGTETGGIGILLPVENGGEDYLANLGQAGWETESETADELLHLTAPAGSALAWSEVYFRKMGPTLVAGRTADDVRKAVAAMPSLPPILPVEGDVAWQIRPAALVAAFRPQIEQAMDAGLKDPTMQPEAAAILQLYLRGYLAVAKQIDEFSMGIGVADGNLSLHSRLAPVAGSTLARWVATVRTPSAAVAAVNLPGALLAEAGHMGDFNLIAPAYFRYVEEVMKLMPAEAGAEFMKTYLETAKAAYAQMDGDFAIALLPPTKETPLRLAEYVSLKDSAALRDMTRQGIQSANEMLQKMMAELGGDEVPPFKFEIALGEPREYRGIQVDTISYALTLDGAVAAQWPAGLPTRLAAEMAWVPGGMLASIGDPSLTDSLVDRALDSTGEPLSSLPAWQAAFPTPEKNLSDVTHLALFDAIRAYAGLVDSFTGANHADAIPAGPGNVESASYVALDGYMSRLRFGLADIAAIGQKIKEAREKALAEMRKQMEAQGEMQFDYEEDAGAGEMDDDEGDEWTDDEPAAEDAGEEEIEAGEPVPAVEEAPPAVETPAAE